MLESVFELIQNAWAGWLKYTDAGKLVALVLAAILYLGLFRKVKGPGGRLLLYGTVSSVLCICPLTAAILMAYQTRFYDYQWIWSMVPVTALIAFGGTVFLTEQYKPGKGWKTIFKNTIVTIASVSLVLLCGGMGQGSVDAVKTHEDRVHSETVLGEVRMLCGEDVCLWAPSKILEYARLDGKMQLFYGRNMWDAALNAYSYDSYTEEQKELYLWMEKLDDWDIEISVAEVEENIQKAFASGVNCVLLPTGMSDWLEDSESEAVLLERLAETGAEVTKLEDYYLLSLR